MSKVYIIVEAVNIFLVYNAEADTPNLVNSATEFSYFAHVFGLLMSIAVLTYENVQFVAEPSL